MLKKILLLCTIAFCSLSINAQVKKAPAKKPATTATAKAAAARNTPIVLPATSERLVQITTPYGTMIAKLYNQTPRHRDNFINLVQQGFYDSLLFHRVIKQFMIQGGDPTSKHAQPDQMLGMGSAPGERVPAEFSPAFFHKKGALAAARDNNPEKASSNCQFYIVEGKPVDTATLQQQNTQGHTYSKQQKDIYARIGGAPFLDQNYTVFGEVISGLEVIDKIASVQTNGANRPAQDVTMTIKMLN